MNRKDLVETIAQQAGLSAAQADAALTAFVAGVTDAVASGDRVAVAGFGTFEPRERSARTGRNPQTGQPIEKVSEDTDRDYWMSAEEAVEYGLISRVVNNLDELED